MTSRPAILYFEFPPTNEVCIDPANLTLSDHNFQLYPSELRDSGSILRYLTYQVFEFGFSRENGNAIVDSSTKQITCFIDVK